jgi:hypothetical protein
MITFDERQAWKIYEAFRGVCQARNVKNLWQVTNLGQSGSLDPRNFDRVRNHRNWRHYLETWLRFRRYRGFRARDLMEAVFRGISADDKVYPGMLNTASAEKAYIKHMEAQEASAKGQYEEVQRIEDWLTSTHRAIRSRLGDLTVEKLWSFFNTPKEGVKIAEGMVLAIHNMLSFYYLAMSKAFETAWRNANDELRSEIALDEQKAQLIRARVRMNERLYSCVRRLFGEDIL